MATYTGTFSGRPACVLTLTVTESSTNSAANTSVASWSLTVTGNSASYNGGLGPWSVAVNGVNWSGEWNYDFRSNNTATLGSGSTTVTHSADGSKTISSSASATDNGSSPLGTASASGSLALTNFTFPPSAPPTAPTFSRTSDGVTITVTSAVASSAVTITDYEYRVSTDNSAWGSAVSMGTDRIATFSATGTQQYWFQTRAISAEGNGSWSSSGTSYGVPSAPASVTASRTARDVTVTVGASATNGGSVVTGSYVQYSTNSGATWSTAVATTGNAYTFTGLTAGLTYRFRAYATNVTGSSAFATSSDLFVPAGGKKWDGSVWTSTTIAKRWDGTAWADLSTAKRWNGSSWVDLS